MRSARRKLKRRRRAKKALITTLCAVSVLRVLYIVLVFSNIPFIKYWRGIWIETAMTTGEHQWLATAFIPRSVIDEVMNIERTDVVGGAEYLETGTTDAEIETGETLEQIIQETEETEKKENDISEEDRILQKDEITEETDILGQNELTVGENDIAGYKVLVNDIEEGIVISEIIGKGYKGKIMLISDPSRVDLVSTVKNNGEGMRMPEILETFDALAGINASGFYDPEGQGDGGTVIGLSYNGTYYSGAYVPSMTSILITNKDRLAVGTISDWKRYDIRAGMQFGPVLIADGETMVDGSYGYGIHPRTAIGQREDGVIMFLVIDGRDVTHSLGCTVGDLAEVLEKYGAVNAACCDGGSSSILAYDGEVITKNSSLNPTLGRRLPNAFVVKHKKSLDSDE